MDTNDTNTSMNVQHSSNQQPPQQQQQQAQPQEKKKCRGNRRDQRFRRKCRALHMEPAKMEKLIKKRHRIQKKDQKKNPTIKHTTNMNTGSTGAAANLNKRKRDVSLQQLSTAAATETMTQSRSQQSTEQPALKKIKNTPKAMPNTMVNGNDTVHMTMNYQYVFFII
jgi:hypothetical protein